MDRLGINTQCQAFCPCLADRFPVPAPQNTRPTPGLERTTAWPHQPHVGCSPNHWGGPPRTQNVFYIFPGYSSYDKVASLFCHYLLANPPEATCYSKRGQISVATHIPAHQMKHILHRRKRKVILTLHHLLPARAERTSPNQAGLDHSHLDASISASPFSFHVSPSTNQHGMDHFPCNSKENSQLSWEKGENKQPLTLAQPQDAKKNFFKDF